LTKIKLTIELVPETCWYSNVRDHVTNGEWDVIRRATYRKAGYVCEICGGKGKEWPVECHEAWEYNDKTHTQKLLRTIALCPNCHSVKHYGRTQMMGGEEEAFKHLMKVNKWNKDKARKYINEIADIWVERSEHDWKLDLSWLKKEFSIKVKEKR